MSHLKAAMDAWPLPAGEPVHGKTYIADGYVYRDLPRLSYELFDEFVALVGEDNIVWLTKADYGTSKRGQILISPDGMARLKAHSETNATGAPDHLQRRRSEQSCHARRGDSLHEPRVPELVGHAAAV